MKEEKLLRDLIKSTSEQMYIFASCIDLARKIITSKDVEEDLQEVLKLTLEYNIALKDVIIRSLKRTIKAQRKEPKCETCPYEHTNCTKTINPDGTTTCHKEKEKKEENKEQPNNKKENEGKEIQETNRPC